MRKNGQRSNTRKSLLQKLKIASVTRKFAVLKSFVAALLFSNNLMAQTITVDGNPGDWPAVLSSSTVSYKLHVTDPVNSQPDNVCTRGSQSTDPTIRCSQHKDQRRRQ